MSGPRCWGIYREVAHSPGRETDDAEILRATARCLTERGFAVELKSPDELPEDRSAGAVPPRLFVMCERPAVIERLADWERGGARIVNRPGAIRNTDRERTLARFAEQRVAFPESVIVPTAGAPPAVDGSCWIKRGDVHATDPGDVVRVETRAELGRALSRLSARGIATAVVQRHVPGDLIKFYGVAGADAKTSPAWFEWFYHRDQQLAQYAFDPAALRGLVARAASALGLDVFGGDAIVGATGEVVLIDVNAWPSFALFREKAAQRIADRLAERFAFETRQTVVRMEASK